MITPTLTISHSRILKAGETYSYVVQGQCTPLPFATLGAAHAYCLREYKKLKGGHLPAFEPTHEIRYQPAVLGSIKRRIPVRMIEGACYQEKEWSSCTIAEFYYDEKYDYLMLQGFVLNWRWSILPV